MRVAYTLIPFLWLLAFFCSLPLFAPPELWRLAAVSCMAFAAVLRVGLIPEGKTVLPLSPCVLALAGFTALAAASIFWSAAPAVSFMVFGSFMLLPLGFVVLAAGDCSPSEGRRGLEVAAAGVALILAALALWALLQYFVLTDWLVHGQVRKPFADPNAYAALLSLGFFPALAMAVTTSRKTYLALALLLLTAVIVIGSRGAIIGIAAGSGLFFRAVPQGRKAVFCMAVCAVAAFAASVIFSSAAQAPVMRLMETGTADDLGALARLHIWQAALAMALDHFPSGTGFGTFFLFYPQYRHAGETWSSGLMAHSDPLQFLTEMGPLSPILFYMFLACVAMRMRRSWKNDKDVLCLSVFCGLGAMAIHTHVSFNLYVAPILALSGLMLGWWHRRTEQAIILRGETEKRRISLKLRFSALKNHPVNIRLLQFSRQLIIIVAAAAFLFLLQGFLFSEYHVDRAYKAVAQGDMAGFAAAVESSNNAAFGLNARPYILAATIPIGVLQTQKDLSQNQRQDLYRQADALLIKAELHNPRLVAIWHDRALLEQAMGGTGEGALKQALDLNPRHDPSRQLLQDAGPTLPEQ